MGFSADFISKCAQVLQRIDCESIDRVAAQLADLRARGGRLFVIGSGGGAGHASHAVCDFRKLCGIEAYAPYDNVSELTARVNDDGWASTLANYLKVSRLSSRDGIFVFSVGGGSKEKNISANLVSAIEYAASVEASVTGVVGKDGGFTFASSSAAVLIPTVDESLITPLTEGFQALVWHCLVSHPQLQINAAKWESVDLTCTT